VEKLTQNLEEHTAPVSLLSQFLPNQAAKIRAGELANRPRDLIRSKICEVTSVYSFACGPVLDGEAPGARGREENDMLREERSRAISGDAAGGWARARARPSETLADIAITIRKDLEFLHHEGSLERTHGGALPVRTGSLKDRSLQERSVRTGRRRSGLERRRRT